MEWQALIFCFWVNLIFWVYFHLFWGYREILRFSEFDEQIYCAHFVHLRARPYPSLTNRSAFLHVRGYLSISVKYQKSGALWCAERVRSRISNKFVKYFEIRRILCHFSFFRLWTSPNQFSILQPIRSAEENVDCARGPRAQKTLGLRSESALLWIFAILKRTLWNLALCSRSG